MSQLTCLTAPAELPVTLAQLQRHLRMEPGEDDAGLAHALATAVAMVDGPDGELGRVLVRQTWRESFAAVPRPGGAVELALSPVLEVTSAEVWSGEGAWQAVAVARAETGGAVELRADWPRVASGQPYPLRLTYVAGFGDAAAVPLPICHAILLLAAHLHELRLPVVLEGTPRAVPLSIARLLAPWKRWWI